jgi:hypothetical protein
LDMRNSVCLKQDDTGYYPITYDTNYASDLLGESALQVCDLFKGMDRPSAVFGSEIRLQYRPKWLQILWSERNIYARPLGLTEIPDPQVAWFLAAIEVYSGRQIAPVAHRSKTEQRVKVVARGNGVIDVRDSLVPQVSQIHPSVQLTDVLQYVQHHGSSELSFVNDAAIGEARVTDNGVCTSGMESRGERPNDSPSVIFNDERHVLESIAVVSQKPTFVEERAVPRLGR